MHTPNSLHRTSFLLIGTLLLLAAHSVHANDWSANRHHVASLAGAPLGFVAPPQSRVVEAGKSTHLAVLTKGPVKTMQWRKNGIPLEGETGQYLEVIANQSPNQIEPDRYDVLIQDAFGKQAVSQAATVTIHAADSRNVSTSLQMEESLKLQNLLNVVDLFKQAAFRIEEAWDGVPLTETVLHRYEVCPGEVTSELMPTVEDTNSSHKAVKLEFKNCHISSTDFMGNEAGTFVSGTYIHSAKKTTLLNAETLQTELFAKNLSLRFPFMTSTPDRSTIDFDIRLDGKLIQTIHTTYIGEFNQRSLDEYQWTSGTRIENPQTGVVATILSGKYSIEKFGEERGGRYIPLRETRYFNNLKLKLGDDNVIIRGLVSKMGDNTEPQRSGNFEIWVNGKAVVKAASAVSPIKKLDVQLPYSPKLNGFFNNDHQVVKSKKSKTNETERKTTKELQVSRAQ